MRLEPPRDWINGIAMLLQTPSPIIAPDPAKGTSRCFLIEAVGPEAAEAGYRVGDIVVALKVWDLIFYNGAYHRAAFRVEEVFESMHDVTLDEFVLLDGHTPATTLDIAASKAAE